MRVSGPLAVSLPARLFPGTRGVWPTHRMRLGDLVDSDGGHTIDRAMGCLMRAPNSYTGEDVFEIHCHGSPVLLERVMTLCLGAGCRPARPGEFTLRAFLAGRLDLTQAEAVLDVVRARSNAGLELAAAQLAGWLGERVEVLRHDLVGCLAHIEAMVDFVEDDIPPQLDDATRATLRRIVDAVEQLLVGAEDGIVLREGATLTIAGSPNVGKSSIMNALLGLERSIVTPVAGTTRDTVEETLQVRGIPFRVVDTAGITRTEDVVERIGVERSHRAIGAADVIMLVLDRSRPWNDMDELALQAVESARSRAEHDGRSPRLVLAMNKSDLPAVLDGDEVDQRCRPAAVASTCAVRTGGLDELVEALARAALGGARHDWVVSNVRHQDALRRAATGLHIALSGLEQGTPLDLVSIDVRGAAQALGEISGANVDDELLDRIFRDFCIGK